MSMGLDAAGPETQVESQPEATEEEYERAPKPRYGTGLFSENKGRGGGSDDKGDRRHSIQVSVSFHRVPLIISCSPECRLQ